MEMKEKKHFKETLGIFTKLFKFFNLLNVRGKAFPAVQQWVFVKKS